MDLYTIGMAVGGSVAGSAAVVKLLPHVFSGQSGSPFEERIMLVQKRQIEILERMDERQEKTFERIDERQEKMMEILLKNTEALTIAMRLEEQRERLWQSRPKP